MSLSITISSQTFDRKSSEVGYYARVLELIINEIMRGQGTVTSGTVNGVHPSGAANTSLGSWTFTPTATNP